MSKLRLMNAGRVLFKCPGCDETHDVPVGEAVEGPHWNWDGSLDKPTLTPSIHIRTGNRVPGYETAYDEGSVCHSWVKAGQIEFLLDCTHELAGHTVPLPDL